MWSNFLLIFWLSKNKICRFCFYKNHCYELEHFHVYHCYKPGIDWKNMFITEWSDKQKYLTFTYNGLQVYKQLRFWKTYFGKARQVISVCPFGILCDIFYFFFFFLHEFILLQYEVYTVKEVPRIVHLKGESDIYVKIFLLGCDNILFCLYKGS